MNSKDLMEMLLSQDTTQNAKYSIAAHVTTRLLVNNLP